MATAKPELAQLEQFIAQLRAISSSDFARDLTRITSDNASLQTQVDELRIANGHTMKHAAGLQALIEELKSKLKTTTEQLKAGKADKVTLEAGKAEVEAALKVKTEEQESDAAEIKRLNTELAKYVGVRGDREKRVKAEKEAAALRSETQGMARELDTFRGMTAKLHRPDADAIGNHLLETIKSTTFLITHFFSTLSPDVLSTSSSWTSLRSHPLIHMAIPLPASNTPAARLMRTSAIMAICSDALLSHVLQPTYTLRDGDEMAGLLSFLATSDPVREAHVRAVLLPLVSEEQQVKNGESRARRAAQEVVRHVEMLLGDQAREFAVRLEEDFVRASHAWRTAQSCAARVQASFDEDRADSWLLLRPGSASPAYDKMTATVNGISRSTTPAVTDDGRPPTIKFVVWPAFFMADGNAASQRLICKGFALDESHMRPAREEENATAWQGVRRGNRVPAARLPVLKEVDGYGNGVNGHAKGVNGNGMNGNGMNGASVSPR